MASFDDDNDPIAGSDEENEDEEMEDVNEADQDADQDMDGAGEEDEEDEGDEDNDEQNDDDEDEDQNEPESPSRRASQHTSTRRSPSQDGQETTEQGLTSRSPGHSGSRSPSTARMTPFIPPVRPEALTALAYDIVPTMAAPQSTSINAIATTPDMRWVMSGGTDGYIRMFNWMDTANGKVPLTVAQKHPFVDSVMKAGSLVTYWENEEHTVRTPSSQTDDTKWLSPVYSLAVQHQAVWLLSGLESGSINLQTCRHQAGTRITTLKEHTSAVSVLVLSQDETSLLSGSWDKNIHEWDLQSGKVKRSFRGSGSQISAIETRPMSSIPVPEVPDPNPEPMNGTFSSNDGNRALGNGAFPNGLFSRNSQLGHGDEDALGSPEGSLFGEGDHGSLFGEDLGGGGGGAGNAFDDDDEDLARALENEMQDNDQDAPGEADTEMTGMGSGGPVQPPEPAPAAEAETEAEAKAEAKTEAEPEEAPQPELEPASGAEVPPPASDVVNGETDEAAEADSTSQAQDDRPTDIITNGLPHSDEPLTAPSTNEDQKPSPADLPPQSESTFLDAAIDGTLRIWDRRVAQPIAKIVPFGGTAPWCTGACWSPDGNFFYVGRRGCTVDEYSIHNLGSKRSEPNRVFKFQSGSGPVYAVRAMPNKKHLVCASNDILRIYDLAQAETKHKQVPFTIVPGHRGGVISSIFVDPTCRFMLSAAGNRGWEGSSTEVLLGYEIGIQDEKGVWLK